MMLNSVIAARHKSIFVFGFQPSYTPHLLDPHELVSWVNKIRKLNALDAQKSRFSLVLAAAGGEHE